MAYTVNLNVGVDTSIPDVSSLSIQRGLPNFGADWRVNSRDQSKDGGAIITNLNSPTAYPEALYVNSQTIANVYKGKNIPLTLWYPDPKGTRLYLSHSGLATVTNSDDSSYLCVVPWTITTTIAVGNHPAFSSSDLITILQRHISDFFETGDTSTARLNALLRGALLPRDIIG